MATVQEMMMDAAASVETAAMMSAGDTFNGTITNSAGDTEDWISIEMEAGTTYTISVSGTLSSENGGEMDTILTLFDSKGGMVDMNDDTMTSLGSELEFTPEVDSTYYISVSTYRNNPNLDNSGTYALKVAGMVVDPAEGKEIDGTMRVEANDQAEPPVEYASGNDKLEGTDDNDDINGLSGDDTIYGLGGDDELDGGDGNDLLVGGPGADELEGGDGKDTISYSYSPAGVTINLTTGTARGGNADGDTIGDDIEHVTGSMYDDVLTGNRQANQLTGLGGNDELDGGRRDDTLSGGAGDDMLDGGDGNDTLEGGAGADMLTGGDHNDVVALGDTPGDTASYAGSMMGVTVRLHSLKAMGGDAGGDVFAGSTTYTYMIENEDEEMEEVEGTAADIENLTGSHNADILAGDGRANTIKGLGGDDKIYGGPGGDGDTNADVLEGGAGNDMVFGGIGDDELHGGAGNDMLWGGAGDDTYMGGAGSDIIYADLDDVDINGYMDMDDDNNTSDVDESMDSAMDRDTLSYANVENDDEMGVRGDNAVVLTGGMISNIENVVGTNYDDNITGDTQANVIEGGAGRDILSGGIGNAEADGNDTLSYENSDDWVRVTLNADGTAATVSRGHARGDTATNFENVTGTAHDDDLTGNGGDNVLKGLAGDDEIIGSDGDDTLEGGAGADELDGDHGNRPDGTNADQQERSMADVLSYAGSDAGVTVHLGNASVSGGHAEGDTIVTYEVEVMAEEGEDPTEIDVSTFEYATGSMHDDWLTGDHRDNHLVGGGGDDTLRGGAGMDLIIGGPGADILDGGEDVGEKNNMVPADPGEDVAEDAMVAASIDWAVYKMAMEGVTVDLSTNKGTGGEAMGDTLVNIELVWGSENADTFIAGPGADIIQADGGSDTVSYEASETGVTVNLGNNSGSNAEHRTVAVSGDGH